MSKKKHERLAAKDLDSIPRINSISRSGGTAPEVQSIQERQSCCTCCKCNTPASLARYTRGDVVIEGRGLFEKCSIMLNLGTTSMVRLAPLAIAIVAICNLGMSSLPYLIGGQGLKWLWTKIK